MKVAYLTGLRKLEIRDEPRPTLDRPEAVLLRIDRVGVCGSDVHYYMRGRIGDQVVQYPATIGHECAGTVIEVGSAVERLKPGDRVAVDPAISCGRCDQCRAGRVNTCRRLRLNRPGCLLLSSPLCSSQTQTNLTGIRVNLQNLNLYFLTFLNNILRLVNLVVGKLRNVQQPFHVRFKLNKCTKISKFCDGALDNVARNILCGDGTNPGVFGHLL